MPIWAVARPLAPARVPSLSTLPARPPLEPERTRFHRMATLAPAAASLPAPTVSMLPPPSAPAAAFVTPSAPAVASVARVAAPPVAPVAAPPSRAWLEPTMELPLPDEDPDVLALVPWYVRLFRALIRR
jgi:hypothetical protein